MSLTRRRFVASAALLGVPASALRAQTPCTPTPAMTEGPFYPEAFTAEPATNLIRGAMLGKPTLLALEGRVTDRFGKPVAGCRMEIWQCDALGRYTHSRDGTPDDRDRNFAGFGWTRTDGDGRYAFQTIRPVLYSRRTPHIHVAAKAPRQQALITQMFVDGESQNQRDFLYRSMTQTQRALVTVKLERAEKQERATFDVTLG
jgi:protocatechuate 3,4-dioxygenase beta subunit